MEDISLPSLPCFVQPQATNEGLDRVQHNNSNTYGVETIVQIVFEHIPFPDYCIVPDNQAGPLISAEKHIHLGSNLIVPPAVLSQCYEAYCPLEDRPSSE